MKKISMFIVALLITGAAHAFDNSAIFKTRSFPCAKSSKSLFGSGVLLNVNSENYILTSEHVLYHQKDNYCFEVINDTYGTLKSELVNVDWGTGLALLKIKANRPLNGISLTDIFTTFSENERVATFGFPLKAFKGLVTGPGYIVASQSDRGLIPMLASMLEVLGAPGEYGMSGGPVMSDGKLVGLLSHQFIKIRAGGPSEVLEYSEGSGLQNNLLVIPGDYIKNWVQEVLSADYRPYFLRDAFAQESGRMVIRTMGLRFSNVSSTIGKDDSEAKVAGIGGNETASTGSSNSNVQSPLFFRGQFAWELREKQVGTESQGRQITPDQFTNKVLPKQQQQKELKRYDRGGGDGAGIGGGLASKVANESEKQVEVTLDNSASGGFRLFDAKYGAWFANLQAGVMNNGQVYVSGLVFKDPATYQLRISQISNLGFMFSALQNVNVRAIVAGQEVKDTACARGISEAISDLQKSPGESLVGNELVERLLEVEFLLKTGNARAIEVEYLVFLQNSTDWKALFNRSFNAAVKLKQKLICLK